MTIAHAVMLHQAGRFQEAEAAYRDALVRNPADHDMWMLLGALLQQRNEVDGALEAYYQAVATDPLDPLTHRALGDGWVLKGRPDQAVEAYRAALRLDPLLNDVRVRLGQTLVALHRMEAAAETFHAALQQDPKDAQACLGLAGVCEETGQYEPALRLYGLAEMLDPTSHRPVAGQGTALAGLRRYAEAEAFYRRALAMSPANSVLESNLAAILKESGRMDDAYALYQAALQHDPSNIGAPLGLAGWCWAQCRFEESKSWYRRTLALDSSLASAHANFSMVLLSLGEYEEGWREYEWRLKIGDPTQRVDTRSFSQPLWDGSEFRGRRLLVRSEQGAGDMIQFCRYLPLVKARGGTVLFECPPRLSRLLKEIPGVDVFVPFAERPTVECDYQIPLLHVPGFFSPSIDSIPASVPYLHAEPALVERHRARVHGPGLRVGLAWQGNKEYKYDGSRSIPLAALRPILETPGVTFYSLQKGPGVEQVKGLPAGLALRDLGGELDAGPDGFVDTAAVMQHLDLIISSDTSIAHVAGALGRPVWVLLSRLPEWRWMLDRSDCPWYPTMRLFRQRAMDDWSWPVREAAEALKTLAQQR